MLLHEVRSHRGNGYTMLDVYSADRMTVTLRSGAVYTHTGAVVAGDTVINAGEGAEVLSPVVVTLRPDTRIIAATSSEPYDPLMIESSIESSIAGWPLGKEQKEQERLIKRHLLVHHKPWGYEVEVPTEAREIQLKRLHIREGQATSLQFHYEKDEIMVDIADGAAMHVSPLVQHRRTGPADYFEASTHHPDDVVRLHDMYGRQQ